MFFFNLFFYFLAVLGLCCYAQAFSSCSEQGLLFVTMHRLLIAAASHVVSTGSRAQRPQQLQPAGSGVQAQ